MLEREELVEALYEDSYERCPDETIKVYEERNICADLVAIQRLVKTISGSNLVLFSIRTCRNSMF